MSITCGIDWAEGHHDVALVDAGGTTLAKLRIDTSGVPRTRAIAHQTPAPLHGIARPVHPDL